MNGLYLAQFLIESSFLPETSSVVFTLTFPSAVLHSELPSGSCIKLYSWWTKLFSILLLQIFPNSSCKLAAKTSKPCVRYSHDNDLISW